MDLSSAATLTIVIEEPGQNRPAGGAGAGAAPTMPGGAAPAVSSAARLDPLERTIKAITASLEQFGQAVQLFTQYTRRTLQAELRALDDDIVGARAESKRATTSQIGGTMAAVGGTLALAGRFLMTKPNPYMIAGGAALAGAGWLVSSLGDASATANEDTFKGIDKQLRARFERLGQYGGPIAGALARSRAAGMGRDIAENQALGPLDARVIESQRRLDTVSQALGAARRAINAGSQLYKLQEETNNQLKEIRALQKRLPKEFANAIEKVLNAKDTDVLDALLRVPKMPTDDRPERENAIQKLRDSALGLPLFGGAR